MEKSGKKEKVIEKFYYLKNYIIVHPHLTGCNTIHFNFYEQIKE